MQYTMFKEKPWKVWVRNALILIVLVGAVIGSGDDQEGKLYYSLREKTKEEKEKSRKTYDFYGVDVTKPIHSKVVNSKFTLDVAYYEKGELAIIRDVIAIDLPDYGERTHFTAETYKDVTMIPVPESNTVSFNTTPGSSVLEGQNFHAIASYQFPDAKLQEIINSKNKSCDNCNQEIPKDSTLQSLAYWKFKNSYDLCTHCHKEKFGIEEKLTMKYVTYVQFNRGEIFWELDDANKDSYQIKEQEGEFIPIPVEEPTSSKKPTNYWKIGFYCLVVIAIILFGGYVIYRYYYFNSQEENQEKNQVTKENAQHEIKPSDCVIEVANNTI